MSLVGQDVGFTLVERTKKKVTHARHESVEDGDGQLTSRGEGEK